MRSLYCNCSVGFEKRSHRQGYGGCTGLVARKCTRTDGDPRGRIPLAGKVCLKYPSGIAPWVVLRWLTRHDDFTPAVCLVENIAQFTVDDLGNPFRPMPRMHVYWRGWPQNSHRSAGFTILMVHLVSRYKDRDGLKSAPGLPSVRNEGLGSGFVGGHLDNLVSLFLDTCRSTIKKG